MPLQETKQIVVFINVLCACSKSADQGHRARAEYETMLHLVIILAEKKKKFIAKGLSRSFVMF